MLVDAQGVGLVTPNPPTECLIYYDDYGYATAKPGTQTQHEARTMMKTKHNGKRTTMRVKGMRCEKCRCPAFMMKGDAVACVQCGKMADVWGAC